MAATANPIQTPEPTVQQPEKSDKTARPEKPNEDAYKINLAKAEKELASAQQQLEAVKSKIDLATPHNQDSPVAKKQQELRSQLAAIRQQQQGFKASRTSLQEKINALDSSIKSRITEQKAARGRVGFKSVEDLDREIQRLEKEVDSGTMKLVDERKALAEVSSLRKQRKGFSGFEESQKHIDDLKTQLTGLKKGLDNPEQKALSEKYTSIQKELDEIKAEQDGVFKNIKSLRDERSQLQGQVQKARTSLREIKDTYYHARKAYREFEQEMERNRRERHRAEREKYERERKKKIADKKLEEASRPAYTDEIITAQGLIRHFDPSYDLSSLGLDDEKKMQSGGFRAEIGRTVDSSDIKGVRVVRKEDRDDDYFIGGGGKKNKKGRKVAATNDAKSQFNLSFGVIEELARVKVDPPMNQSDVPSVIEKLVEKLQDWKKNQAAKTEENIKKAKEELAKLEQDDVTNGSTDHAKKPALQNAGVNGHVSAEAELRQENDAVADAAQELQEAKLEE
ncbi:multicopy suppressor of BFA (Brefeldin A) [Ophidiomyces ophidiicola]|uniref:Multicopy suppressor of BFA (Brefeldin A) n=1 Tax=Ophidiomyces ophidiicola TaxID=1387563 RepID=A0ACB8V573_9EURO|nr:multicopy suppressor of BFA (Brefeldin A) [Ophidiomyces ophidiicola]KAI1915464.1 multicopy suppressor of BFA (Brefeldin A) [Ophidiomyces ophidiicola]KAI1926078.1 multicopy suppressor of BFA (Brefeldin A) [Ophidiomyces ophidiicola]KAI1929903.1 multicopy suppressor of BFA (Brefeldin A) [Ophidiomyces ophidiicola]KAI1947153.1 multicopy suppressor of BFA (Brefeldin A) [Ophidiomyces ophidiicola]KAI1955669.1 multicopy suppressor of BFA (Brefeldin A) [Ophidiomyces ophidiicola]